MHAHVRYPVSNDVAYAFADEAALRVLALTPTIDATLLAAPDLRVDVPDPGETLSAALRRLAPSALLLDAALIDDAVVETLGGAAGRGLPLVLLVDLEHADRAGLLLGGDVRFAPPLAPLPMLRELLHGTAAAGAADGTAWRPDAAPTTDLPPPDLAQVRAVIRARRARARFFPEGWFADPAWDMLLDLAVAELSGARVSVSALCIAADVPATTALRWIKRLCDEGRLVRTGDPLDRRRMFIAMSPETSAAMRGCLHAVLGQLAL